jgi:hypothetical protein
MVTKYGIMRFVWIGKCWAHTLVSEVSAAAKMATNLIYIDYLGQKSREAEKLFKKLNFTSCRFHFKESVV